LAELQLLLYFIHKLVEN